MSPQWRGESTLLPSSWPVYVFHQPVPKIKLLPWYLVFNNMQQIIGDDDQCIFMSVLFHVSYLLMPLWLLAMHTSLGSDKRQLNMNCGSLYSSHLDVKIIDNLFLNLTVLFSHFGFSPFLFTMVALVHSTTGSTYSLSGGKGYLISLCSVWVTNSVGGLRYL